MREEKITYRIEYDFCGKHFEMNLSSEKDEQEVKKTYAEWCKTIIPWSAKNIKLLKITVITTAECIG
ncbi:MAG: hypothetical protein V1661_02765 [bacterium]